MLLEEKNLIECLIETDESLYSINKTMTPEETEPRMELLQEIIQREKQRKSTIIQRKADSHL